MTLYTKKWTALAVLLSAHLLTIVDIFIINVAIPSIQRGIRAADSEIQLIVSIYMIGLASFLIIAGKAGDHYGRKKVFLLGIFLFMLSSIGCCFAAKPGILMLMRFLQGISAALMSPQVLSFIQVLFTHHTDRTYAIGLYGITIGLGTTLGQFLGGYLVGLEPVVVQQSWQYIFMVNVPICIAAIVMGSAYLPESKDTSSRGMDYTGAGLLCSGLVCLIFSVTIGRDLGAAYCLVSLLFSLIILTAFVINQRHKNRKSKTALLNTALFKYKNFNMALAAVALFMLMLDSYFFILTLFLQKALLLPPLQAGYFVAAQGLGFLSASLFTAKLLLRYGRAVLIIGVIMIIGALILQLFTFNHSGLSFIRLTIMVLHGCGVALVLPSLAGIAISGLTGNLAGSASGLYTTVQQLFGAFGIALTGAVFYHIVKGGDNFGSYYSAFLYGIAINIICLIGVLLILVLLPKSSLPNGFLKNKNLKK
ncbi:MFS transporter [Flavobacterium sp. SORGH_AS_0622]|uniref:MFS transporter n=1 Tax=Flavobacterium sp. SORGH_AS_0622 TaxID=3041772 RepID=UPI002786075C|nr:MFS transporter [Flavobacterium sp. SORGH_AS_0622]MDQ1165649.1 EmrB/QacA subfamily drug resistance transporter [Flavobacterium sp. SORGH_AS_0622]